MSKKVGREASYRPVRQIKNGECCYQSSPFVDILLRLLFEQQHLLDLMEHDPIGACGLETVEIQSTRDRRVEAVGSIPLGHEKPGGLLTLDQGRHFLTEDIEDLQADPARDRHRIGNLRCRVEGVRIILVK